MKPSTLRLSLAMAVAAAALLTAGCAKKAVEHPPTAATPPPAATPVPSTPMPSTPSPAATPAPSTPSATAVDLQPAFFDYDSDALRDDARAALDKDAKALRANASLKIVIEGHCDERGTEEYNQALGERRAQAARDYLVQAGIDTNRLRMISYGKERPFADGHDDAAWAQNRRAHLVSQ